jgi:imidazolonepropionase-like amidohydrolase
VILLRQLVGVFRSLTNLELLCTRSGTLFSTTGGIGQNRQLTKLTRWYSPAEVLRMATGDNAQLLALSGPRNPYPGKLGVVEEGAFADLLLVQGDPVANINLIETPGTNLVVIMKDGKIYKNLLP